ncbi:MAG: cysteine peptidase family C39 domain-containing protein, partial [Alphaproteobacteria bacterium]
MSDKSQKNAAKGESGAPASAYSGHNDPLLECLVYLTKHYGRAKSGEALVAGLPYEDKNMGPELFCDAAQNTGLKARIVHQPSLNKISNASLPVVMILKNNQACLLLESSKNGKKCKIFLPETRAVKDLPSHQIANDYAGYAIYVHPDAEFLNPESVDPEDNARHWFWSIIHEARGIYVSVMLASVFINLFVLVSPLFIMNVYDRVIPNNAIETGWALGIGALTVFVFDFVLKTIRAYLIDLSGRRIDVIAGRRIYDQVLNMKLAGRPKSSGVFANMLKDFDSVREFFTSASITVLVDLPFTALFLFVIYKLAGPLAFVLVGLISLPLLAHQLN